MQSRKQRPPKRVIAVVLGRSVDRAKNAELSRRVVAALPKRVVAVPARRVVCGAKTRAKKAVAVLLKRAVAPHKRVEKVTVVAAPEVPSLVAFVVALVRVARVKKATAELRKRDAAVLAKKVARAKRVVVLKRADPSRSDFHSIAATQSCLSDPNSKKPRLCMAGFFHSCRYPSDDVRFCSRIFGQSLDFPSTGMRA